jgi:hypothetical protein
MIFKNIRKKSKLYSILFSALLLFPTGADVKACWYGPEPEELRYMLFNPDLLQDKSWWSFFYNGKLNYLDGTTFSADDEMVLATEWVRATKVSVRVDQAFDCLFGSLSDSALQHNEFYKEIQRKPDFKRYFDIARSSEAVTSWSSAWEEDEAIKRDVDIKFNETTQEVIDLLKKETNPFFQKKYAFQLTKLAFYSTDSILFHKVYNQYFKNVKERTVLDWWAMHYKSMVLERENKMDSANYLHALVFSHSSNKMFASKQYFSSKNFDAVIALAKNNEERADIYLMREVINPGRSLDGILKVYQFLPTHRHLPLLISREINKLEDWLETTKFANSEIVTESYWGDDDEPLMQNWQRDYEYLKNFITALEEMQSIAKSHPVYYNFSLACLNLIKGDAVQAEKYIARIKPSGAEQAFQLTVFQLVLLTLKNDIEDSNVQDEIGKLYQQLLDQRELKFESQKILYSLSSYLRYTFAKKGMVHLAGLFDNYAVNKFCSTCHSNTFEYSMISYLDRYASIEDLNKLLEMYDRKGKNVLEETLLKPYINKYYLLDLLSAKHLRKGDVKNAMLVLKDIPDSFWFSFTNASFYIDSDPFVANSELLTEPTMTTYNKREILERMYALEREVAADVSKKKHNYLLLANAWYNFTDNSWFMISYGWGSITPDEGVYKKAKSIALEYYKKALAFEEQKENKAKILYMIAVLSVSKDVKAYAQQYETYSDTEFYMRRNCLTLKDIAAANL